MPQARGVHLTFFSGPPYYPHSKALYLTRELNMSKRVMPEPIAYEGAALVDVHLRFPEAPQVRSSCYPSEKLAF